MVGIQKRQSTAKNALFNFFSWQLKGNFTAKSLKKWVTECLTNANNGWIWLIYVNRCFWG